MDYRGVKIVNPNLVPNFDNCAAFAISVLTGWSIERCYDHLGLNPGKALSVFCYNKPLHVMRAYLHVPGKNLTTDGFNHPYQAILHGRSHAGYISCQNHVFAFRDGVAYNCRPQDLDASSDAPVNTVREDGAIDFGTGRFAFVVWLAHDGLATTWNPDMEGLYKQVDGANYRPPR